MLENVPKPVLMCGLHECVLDITRRIDSMTHRTILGEHGFLTVNQTEMSIPRPKNRHGT